MHFEKGVFRKVAFEKASFESTSLQTNTSSTAGWKRRDERDTLTLMLPPWEHPDWYDLHDTAYTAGPEREPEHYKELVLALPPLDTNDHLVDIGAGTGKIARLVAKAYPELGRITLVEPNPQKLIRAERGLAEAMPRSATRIKSIAHGLGENAINLVPLATVITVGSVFMPILELRGGALRDGLSWLERAFGELRNMLTPDGTILLLETLAMPWARGGGDARVRRLHLPELEERLRAAGLGDIECTYRFRDRVVLRVKPIPKPEAKPDPNASETSAESNDQTQTRVMANAATLAKL